MSASDTYIVTTTQPATTSPLPPGTAENKAVQIKEITLRGKSFRSMKIAASILEVAEKFGDFARLTDKVPVLGLIAWCLVALCDILRYHFQRMHYQKNKNAITETEATQYDFGHKKVVRFRGTKCLLSCLKALVHLVATVLQFTLPGVEKLFEPISTALSAISSSFTLNDDSHKYAHKVKHKLVPGITNPFARIGLLIQKTMRGTITDGEYREVSAFTGKALFTAIGLIGAGLAIACFAMGPLAPVGLALIAGLISAFGVIGYSTCSISKAAFDLQEAKEKKQKATLQTRAKKSQSLPIKQTGKRPREFGLFPEGNRRKSQSTGVRPSRGSLATAGL